MLKKFLPHLMITILIVSSVSMSSMTANATTTSVNQKYTGEELYLAVVLGQGPVAEEHFKDSWSAEDFNTNNSEEAISFGEDLVSEMKKIEPDYFSDLKTAVYSNDYVKTKKVFDDGKELITESFQNLGETVELDKESSIEPAAGLALPIYAVAAFGAAVVVTHAVAVTFYFKAAAGGPGLNSQNTEFDEEQVVAELIEAVN